MKLSVYKMHGTGNDFLIFDARSDQNTQDLLTHLKAKSRPEFVKSICHRNFGIGADGFIFIENSKDCDFKWDFYNADGSSAEMCGNAARCVTLWAYTFKLTGKSLCFETLSGIIKGSVESDSKVIIDMTCPTQKNFEQNIEINNKSYQYDFINSGVPHVVITLPSIEPSPDLISICRSLRAHETFKPEGANITLVKEVKAGVIESVSFERGVEGFTLACGTGAVAAAISYQHTHSGLSTVQVNVPGGGLSVDLSHSHPTLIGPAKFIMKAQLI